jgi:hypothetical protein
MKFNHAYEDDPGAWTLDVRKADNGYVFLEVSIKESSRKWRREYISLTATDATKLARYLSEGKP